MANLSDDLAVFLAEQCERFAIPGAAVGVIVDGTQHVACHGVTSVIDPLPVDPDTLFMIGSVSKTVTATALMALVERGRLSLQDRVLTYVPDLMLHDEQARETVTIGHLLDHTAGWVGDGGSNTGWGDDALIRALPELLASKAQLTPPGTMMSYNNAAFVLAGHVLATVTGTTYEQAVRDLVLEPLGLNNSWFFPWEVAQRRSAVGHIPRGTELIPQLTWPQSRWILPAGGLSSSIRDLLTYGRFHLDGTTTGSAPISEPTRRSMQQLRATSRSAVDGVGVSWMLQSYGSVRLVHHGGNVSNLQLAQLTLAPDEGLVMAMLTSSVGGKSLAGIFREWVLDRVVGWQPPPAPPTLAMSAELAAEYVGRYRLGQWDLVVRRDNGALTVATELLDVPEDAPAEIRAAWEGSPLAVVLTEPDVIAAQVRPAFPVGDFVRDSGGAVRFLRHGLRLAKKLD